MRYPLSILLAIAATTSSQAAFTPLGTMANDPANYGSFTGAVLDSVTLNNQTYLTSQLVQIELTAFKGATGSVMLQQNGGTSSPTAQQRRDFLETDWRGDTGIINPSSDSNSVGATFNVPVFNIAGPDMFLYEINNSSADGFQIEINGTQLTVAPGDYANSGAGTNNADVLSLSSTPTNLTQLLTLSASTGSTNISQNIVGVAIDFSDFGVALGDSVTSFSYNSNGASTFDPVIVAAVPEPQTYAMLAGALALACVAYRRRR